MAMSSAESALFFSIYTSEIMKNLKSKNKLILAAIVMFGLTNIIMSCNKQEELEAKTRMLVSDFAKTGEIHNAFLTNVKDNFEAVKGLKDESDRIEVINNFNKDFISTLELSSAEKQGLKQSLEENKSLVVTSNLTEKCFSSNNLKSGGDNNLFGLLEQLKIDNQINGNTYRILNRLSVDLKLNYENSLSDAELKQSIQGLITEFNDLGYDISSGEGEMVATILSVSIASIEWWEQNPDAFADNQKRVKALPVWAAADVVGGVLGAGVSATAQYGVKGKVNWKVVGISAVAGAVAGSTGIVGKAAKFISSWF